MAEIKFDYINATPAERLALARRAEAERIFMDSVRRINRIDDPELRSLQRVHARFINTAMMVTLGGSVVSDGLENGQVVSGVGGRRSNVFCAGHGVVIPTRLVGERAETVAHRADRAARRHER